jgi:hypothetical protein
VCGRADVQLATWTKPDQGFEVWGNLLDDLVGYSVADAGDVNKDGYRDVLIGATGEELSGKTDVGAVYLVFGSAGRSTSTIDTAASLSPKGLKISGVAADDRWGRSVSGAGDFNKDGIDDFIVSTFAYDPFSRTNAGAAVVIFGKTSGWADIDLASFTSGSAGFWIYGAAAGDNLGIYVSGAGDVNGDGVDDVIIGASAASPLSRQNAGTTYVIFGHSTATTSGAIDLAGFVSGSAGFKIYGRYASEYSACRVSGLQDVNGDGYDDIIVGSPDYVRPGGAINSGAIYVIFGHSNATAFTDIDLAALSSSQGFRAIGEAGNNRLGWSVSSAGDYNLDGYDDIVIGSTGNKVYILFGHANTTSFPDIDFATFATGSAVIAVSGSGGLGFSVSGGVDVNGDGVDDIGITAPQYSSVGAVYVLFGRAQLVVSDINLQSGLSAALGYRIVGTAAASGYEWTVSLVRDFDGDGGGDVLVGIPVADLSGRAAAGAACLVYGEPPVPTSQPSRQPTSQPTRRPTSQPSVQPSRQPSSLPSSLPSGQPTTQPSRQPTSQPSQHPVALPTSQPSRRPTSQPSVQPSRQPSGVPSRQPTSQPSRQPTGRPSHRPLSERAGDVDLASWSKPGKGLEVWGTEPGDLVGNSVADAGDVNGDGYRDIVIGAYVADLITDAGAAYLVFGSGSRSTSVIDTAVGAMLPKAIKITGANTRDNWGLSVSGVGDFNKDGIDDFLVGTFGFDPSSREDAGGAVVIFGKTSGWADINLASFTSGSAGFWIWGAAAADGCGSFSRAGDVNGDGTDDIIAGAPGADPQSRSNAGTSYVIFGYSAGTYSTTDLSVFSSGSAGFKILGAAAGDMSGGVAGAGDVNGDGYSDVIIAAYAYDGPGGTNCGAVYVIFGHSTATAFTDVDLAALSNSQGFRITGAAANQNLGSVVSRAGDFNHDGYGDIIFGSSVEKVYLLFGHSNVTAFPNVDLTTFTAGAAGFMMSGSGSFGSDVRGGADVNKDGVDDVAITAPFYASVGVVYVLFGRSQAQFVNINVQASLSSEIGYRIVGSTASTSGAFSVCLVKDFDGDGVGDVVVGVPNADPANRADAGAAYVIYGELSAPTSQPSTQPSGQPSRWPTVQPSAQPFAVPTGQPSRQPASQPSGQPSRQPSSLPSSLPSGQPTTPPSRQPTSQPSQHPVALPTSQPSRRPTSQPSVQPSRQPSSVPSRQPTSQPSRQPTGRPSHRPLSERAGDVNLASWSKPGKGLEVWGTEPDDLVGASVADAGDVNGDGYQDVLVGAYSAGLLTNAGAAYLVFGSGSRTTSVIDTAVGAMLPKAIKISGANTRDYWGISVSGVGDFNKDGIDDFIIGAHGFDPPSREDAGGAVVIFGKTSGWVDINLASFTSGSAGFWIWGAAAGDESGSFSRAGDVNGDGADDIIMGAPGADPQSRDAAGMAYVIFGFSAGMHSTTDLSVFSSGSAGFKILGAVARDFSGDKVNGAGDVNGDGYSDVTVAAYACGGPGGTDCGTAYVIFGHSAATAFTDIDLVAISSSQGFRITGAAAIDRIGIAVGSAGDFNHDGYGDIIVGSAGNKAYILFGHSNATAFPDVDLHTFTAGTAGFMMSGSGNFGFSVGGGVDVNNDGVDDVALSAAFYAPVGVVYVLFGRSQVQFVNINVQASLPSEIGYRIVGSTASMNGAFSVALVKDFDGDGVGDVVVGAPNADPSNRAEGGIAYMIYGELSAPTSQPSRQPSSLPSRQPTLQPSSLPSRQPTSQPSQHPVALPTSQPSRRPTSQPSVQPSRQPTGIPSRQPTSQPSRQPTGRPSHRPLSERSGDVNLASWSKPGKGLEVWGTEPDDRLGNSVADAGDVNGDGYQDVLVGAYSAGLLTDAGAAYLVFGSASRTTSVIDTAGGGMLLKAIKITGANTADTWGISVSGVGDFNKDGIDDFIVGGHGYDPPSRTDAGAAVVIFGKTSGWADINVASFTSGSAGFWIWGAATDDRWGSFTRAGDVNGDGADDIVVGSTGADPQGKSRAGSSCVIFGYSAGTYSTIDLSVFSSGSAGFKILGAAAGDNSGAVAAAGDVNGDGYSDVIVAAYAYDGPAGTDCGAVYVIFGHSAATAFTDIDLAALTSSQGFRVTGAAANDNLGSVISRAGDFNHDGYGDIIFGSSVNKAYILFGHSNATAFPNVDLPTLTAGTMGFMMTGSGSFGHDVRGGADLNSDGVDDVAITAPFYAPVGEVYVLFGRSNVQFVNINVQASLSSEMGYRILGAAPSMSGFWGVALVRDFDGDGVGDVVIGVQEADPSGRTDAGTAYLIYGELSAPTSQPSRQPSSQPSSLPTGQPTGTPSRQPTSQPSSLPSRQPSSQPSSVPSGQPTNQPSRQPTSQPSSLPSRQPSSQPSSAPSLQPTAQPSRQPTSQPSSLPTGQPTRQPSSQPSLQPSVRPSQQPTRQPTAQPSRQPAASPSAQPSRQPIVAPTSQPSSQPTSQPSKQPSARPSAQPSRQPTAMPSAQPSRQPAARPSGQPSRQPTGHPSAQPSRQPTRQPSGSPTTQPTSQPTEVPSRQPTQQPVNMPTAQPSTQPTRQPSKAPSNQPSLQPSAQPTGQPTSCPSSFPSSRPSAEPSSQPTYQPSQQPSAAPSARPSSHPSGQPSYTPSLQPNSQPSAKPSRVPTVQPSGHPSAQPSTQPSSRPTNAPSAQPISQPSARPSRRPSALPSSLPSSQPTSQPSRQPTTQPSHSPSRQPTGHPSTQPSRQPTTQPSGVPSRQPTAQPSCAPSGQPTRCPTSQPSRQPTTQPTSQPTCRPSAQPTSVPTAVVVTPATLGCSVVVEHVGRTAATVEVALRGARDGTVKLYAVMNIAGSSQYSDATVAALLQGSDYAVQIAGLKPVAVNVSALRPSTDYDIYCAATSLQGVSMPLSGILSTKQPVRTSCCKTITVTVLHPATVSLGQELSRAVTVALEAAPSASMVVTVQYGARDQASAGVQLLPSVLRYDNRSATGTSRDIRLTALGAGNYTLVVSVAGSSAAQYSVVYVGARRLAVLSADATPAVPKLLQAAFSNDGSYVTLSFDSATDRGNQYGTFSCRTLLQFVGGSSAQCQWFSDSQLRVYPTATGTGAVLGVGSNVTVVTNTVRAKCIDAQRSVTVCASYVPIASTTVYAAAPSAPTVPSVVISAPSSIGGCNSLTFDLAGSVGAAGRPWDAVSFAVTTLPGSTSAADQLLRFLFRNYTLSPPLPVPSAVLVKGFTYSIKVTLCNFLKACGSATKAVSVADSVAPVPVVTIVGQPVRTLYRTEPLSVVAEAYTQSCSGTKSSVGLQYSWAVTQLLPGATSNVNATLRSASQNPTVFKLPAYALTVGVTYTLVVSALSTASGQRSSAAVQLKVAQSDLVAVLKGGSTRYAMVGDVIKLDASGSYDKDYPQQALPRTTVSYAWNCLTVAPVLSAECAVTLLQANIGRSDVINVTSTFTALNTTTVVSVTVSDASRSSTAQVRVIILQAPSPRLSITTAGPTDNVNTGKPFTLLGSLYLLAPCTAAWSVDDPTITLSTAARTPVQQSTLPAPGAASVPFNLVIKSDALPQRATLQFTLSCGSTAVSTTVTTNGAPLPGSFYVTPEAGVELLTTFTFTAVQWSDPDLPLTYQFGFQSAVSLSNLVIVSRSELSYATSSLPAGDVSRSNAVDCSLRIFDSLGAFAYRATTVLVDTPGNADQATQLVLELLKNNADSVQGVKTALAVGSSVINAANCTAAPSCAPLNRQPCRKTSGQCGACLDGFVGDGGDRNTPCVAFTAPPEQLATAKSCAFNCTGHGQCTFVSKVTGTTAAGCTLADTDCDATCVCIDNYSGEFCEVDPSTLRRRREVRSNLIRSLSNLTVQEDINTESVAAWSANLYALSIRPHEVSQLDAAVLADIANTTLHHAIALGVDSYAAMLGVLQATDAVASLQRYNYNPNDYRDADFNTSRSYVNNTAARFVPVVSTFGDMVRNIMVLGENETTLVYDNFCLTVALAAGSHIQEPHSVPSGEQQDTAAESSVALQTVADAAIPAVVIKVLSTHPRSYTQDTIDYVSSPVILQVQTLESEVSSAAEYLSSIEFTFQHNALQMEYMHYAERNFTSTCRAQNASKTFTYRCPDSGHVIRQNCSQGAGVYVSYCPKPAAACGMLALETAEITTPSACTVLNSTASHTTCRCTVHAGGSAVKQILDATGATDMLATTVYIASDFADTFNSADSLNNATLSSVLVVVLLLGSVWVAGLSVLAVEWGVNWYNPATEKNAKESDGVRNILAYVDSVIPEVFQRGASSMQRLVAEVAQHHVLFQLVTADTPAERWFLMMQALTELTLLFFLTAAFFDISQPGDDGSCPHYTVPDSCLTRVCPFDHSQTYCKWVEVGVNGIEGECLYNNQDMSTRALFFMTILTTVISSIVSVPIEYQFATLKAPTALSLEGSKVSAAADTVVSGARRVSNAGLAFFEPARVTPASSPVASPTSESSRGRSFLFLPAGDGVVANREIPASIAEVSAAARGSMEIVGRNASTLALGAEGASSALRSRSTRVARRSSIAAGANSLNKHEDAVVRLAEATVPTTDGTNYDDHGAVLLMHDIVHQRHLMNSSAKETKTYDEQWGVLPDGVGTYTVRPEAADCIEAAVRESSKEASRLDKALSNYSLQHAGLEMLHLFMLDLLGRNTIAAKIFREKFGEEFGHSRVVVALQKYFAAAALLALNAFFIYYVMIKGVEKGRDWQVQYVTCCLVQIGVDILLFETIECAWLNFLVPQYVHEEVASAAEKLRSLTQRIAGLRTDIEEAIPEQEVTKFFLNAPAHLFVSTKLARKKPQLLESMIVGSYRHHLPGEICKTWPHCTEREGTQQTTQARTWLSLLRWFLRGLTLSLQLFIGVPFVYQKVALRFVQPVVFSGLALVIYTILTSVAGLVAIGVSVFAVVAYAARRWWVMGGTTSAVHPGDDTEEPTFIKDDASSGDSDSAEESSEEVGFWNTEIEEENNSGGTRSTDNEGPAARSADSGDYAEQSSESEEDHFAANGASSDSDAPNIYSLSSDSDDDDTHSSEEGEPSTWQ